MKKLYYSLLLSSMCFIGYGQFWTRTNASIAAVGNDVRMLATHCGDTVFGLTYNNNGQNILTVSTDKGSTWSNGQAIFTSPINGLIALVTGIFGTENRLYARVRAGSSSYLNVYYYSEDLGNTWNVDTIGLPRSLNPDYIHSMTISELGNGYLVAYSETYGAYFKHISASSWTKHQTYTSSTGKKNLAFTNIGNTWYALNGASSSGGDDLTVSTDFGQTWSPITLNGIPAGFNPYYLVSNHMNKLYLAGRPNGTNANQLFYSTDGGMNWDSTNTSNYAQYTYASLYLYDLIAIEDYVFATFFPTTGDTVSRILTSSTSTPNFSLCDVSGLPVYPTNTFSLAPPQLNYFNIGPKLFITYANDIYTSTPGFTGNNSGIGLKENNLSTFTIYPNPASSKLHVNSEDSQTWSLVNLNGQVLESGILQSGENTLHIQVANGLYLFQVGNQVERVVIQH